MSLGENVCTGALHKKLVTLRIRIQGQIQYEKRQIKLGTLKKLEIYETFIWCLILDSLTSLSCKYH